MLNWETILNTSPNEEVQTTHMAEEPNNKLYQYVKEDPFTWDRFTQIDMGDYTNPSWGEKAQHLTTKKVRRIGIKHFPQTGAIGFWSLLNEQKSQILAPVHHEVQKYAKPNFRIEETAETLVFHISSPEDINVPSNLVDIVGSDVKYLCFRIILRLDAFALEYITYEETLEVPKPKTTGTYDIYCVGYIHEGEAVSEDSDHYALYIEGTRDTWPGPEGDIDLYLTEVDITATGKISVTRSDGFKQQTNNTYLENLSKRVKALEDTLGEAVSLVDEINGEVV